MNNSAYYKSSGLGMRFSLMQLSAPRKVMIAVIMLVALLAFEIFNFDTTRYALESLLGPVTFLSLKWATILAIAFCAIDFAGLIRLFTPERGGDEPREVWYLMGAWLLGATMNAVMTWWAVSLTLLNHDFGNEVLSRSQLLRYVPIFVAVLVWLTRILFIGSFTVAGEHIFDIGGKRSQKRSAPPNASQRGTNRSVNAPRRAPTAARTAAPRPAPKPSAVAAAGAPPAQPARERNSRIRQRPPMPNRVRRTGNGRH